MRTCNIDIFEVSNTLSSNELTILIQKRIGEGSVTILTNLIFVDKPAYSIVVQIIEYIEEAVVLSYHFFFLVSISVQRKNKVLKCFLFHVIIDAFNFNDD
jgi:hypothetical protein